jgi:hypothetical protein
VAVVGTAAAAAQPLKAETIPTYRQASRNAWLRVLRVRQKLDLLFRRHE